MQQTQKYKLNLIESSDPFLPDALNANTQKIEDVLIDKMEGPLSAFDGRVTALEAHRFFVGTYTGTGESPQFVDLGFTPIAVCVCATGGSTFSHWGLTGFNKNGVDVVEGGFKAGNFGMVTLYNKGVEYPFLVFV